ncbi:MAG: hypothetical protein Q8868_02370 [Bacteroidota bacterium]|nr:hypothetical protein [Bacteroidota bacterium]
MATTYIRESTISKATNYLNQIRRMVGKKPDMLVTEMKKEATRMHIGTTYIDQAIALGYFTKNDKGIWKSSLIEGSDFKPSHARAMVEKSNEYNRSLMHERDKKHDTSKVQKKAVVPARSVYTGRRKAVRGITERAIQKYLTDKVILEQFMKKRLISNLDVCLLTSELHRRGLKGTLSGSIQV